MNNVVLIPKPNELEEFMHFLFEGLQGYMYVVAKVPDDPDSWDQVFFEYPTQVPSAVKAINTYSKDHEIYIAPAIFKHNKHAQKDNVKATNVLWLDFDGNVPDEFEIPPSYYIQSSDEQHAHVYWKLDSPLVEVEVIEDFNRRLCYRYAADLSGWDANQVLRPPYTTNHKRGGLLVSTVLEKSAPETYFNLEIFNSLAPAPEKAVDYSLWEKIDLPTLNDVIYNNKFGPDFKALFEKSAVEVNDRSSSLTNMAYICCEAGLGDKEIYVIISHLADRWGKFKHHTSASRAKQLISIIEHARIKYPSTGVTDFDTVFVYSPKTLLETDIQIEYAIEGMLMANGVMLMAGPSGIGKTQIALQFMAHIAMGESFLNYSITEPKRVGFFSLEMGDMELKSFLQSMYPIWVELYGPEKVALLNTNLQLIPFGEALPLNTTQGQNVFVQYLEQFGWEGVFIDSVGSAIYGNISSSETVQAFTNFNDKIRKRYGCFLWYIHHFRKPAAGQTSHGGQEDLFGDQYLTARATSVYTVTKGKNGLLRIKNPKNRHSPTQETFNIRRENGLFFTHQGIENLTPNPLEDIIKSTGDSPVGTDQSPKLW